MTSTSFLVPGEVSLWILSLRDAIWGEGIMSPTACRSSSSHVSTPSAPMFFAWFLSRNKAMSSVFYSSQGCWLFSRVSALLVSRTQRIQPLSFSKPTALGECSLFLHSPVCLCALFSLALHHDHSSMLYVACMICFSPKPCLCTF